MDRQLIWYLLKLNLDQYCIYSVCEFCALEVLIQVVICCDSHMFSESNCDEAHGFLVNCRALNVESARRHSRLKRNTEESNNKRKAGPKKENIIITYTTALHGNYPIHPIHPIDWSIAQCSSHDIVASLEWILPHRNARHLRPWPTNRAR